MLRGLPWRAAGRERLLHVRIGLRLSRPSDLPPLEPFVRGGGQTACRNVLSCPVLPLLQTIFLLSLQKCFAQHACQDFLMRGHARFSLSIFPAADGQPAGDHQTAGQIWMGQFSAASFVLLVTLHFPALPAAHAPG